MNTLFILGLLIFIAYLAGWLASKAGLPRIVGYLFTGVIAGTQLSNTDISYSSDATRYILYTCLAFITFEVGDSLEWQRLKAHGAKLLGVTLFESLTPAVLLGLSIVVLGLLFPGWIAVEGNGLFAFALLLGALACPTDPTATIAVIHQYHCKGDFSKTILNIAAFDDAVGVITFSLASGASLLFMGGEASLLQSTGLALYQIGTGVLSGVIMSYLMNYTGKFLKLEREGQWIILIISVLLLCFGGVSLLHGDEVIACMVMEMMTVNFLEDRKIVFRIITRYTEELIFLLFFLFGGLQMDLNSIPQASALVLVYVIVRAAGKLLGATAGAHLFLGREKSNRYLGGGLIPQGGIVLGLALITSENAHFQPFSQLLVTTVMGAVIINELSGPLMAKWALYKAGEIKAG